MFSDVNWDVLISKLFRVLIPWKDIQKDSWANLGLFHPNLVFPIVGIWRVFLLIISVIVKIYWLIKSSWVFVLVSEVPVGWERWKFKDWGILVAENIKATAIVHQKSREKESYHWPEWAEVQSKTVVIIHYLFSFKTARFLGFCGQGCFLMACSPNSC